MISNWSNISVYSLIIVGGKRTSTTSQPIAHPSIPIHQEITTVHATEHASQCVCRRTIICISCRSGQQPTMLNVTSFILVILFAKFSFFLVLQECATLWRESFSPRAPRANADQYRQRTCGEAHESVRKQSISFHPLHPPFPYSISEAMQGKKHLLRCIGWGV